MTTLKKLLLPFTAVLMLAFVGLSLAQNSPGGVFNTSIAQTIGGQWTWRGQANPFIFEGTTDNASETTFAVTNPTADRTVTLQDATGTLVLSPATTSGAVEAALASLDGSNPTSVTTGLSALAGCTVQQHTSTTPTFLTTFTTLTTAVAGRLDIYAWAATSASDPTLIASTSVDTVRYVCIGTR